LYADPPALTVCDVRLFDGTRVLEVTHLRVVDASVDASVADASMSMASGGGRRRWQAAAGLDRRSRAPAGYTQLVATFVTTVIDQFSKPEVIDLIPQRRLSSRGSMQSRRVSPQVPGSTGGWAAARI
jgi:hypothetical protein